MSDGALYKARVLCLCVWMWQNVCFFCAAGLTVLVTMCPESTLLIKWLQVKSCISDTKLLFQSLAPTVQSPSLVQVGDAPMTPAAWLGCRRQGVGAYRVHLLLLPPAAPHTVHSWTGTRFNVVCGPSLKQEFDSTVKEDGFVVVEWKTQ